MVLYSVELAGPRDLQEISVALTHGLDLSISANSLL